MNVCREQKKGSYQNTTSKCGMITDIWTYREKKERREKKSLRM